MDAMQSLTGVGCGVCVFCGWRLLFLMVGCRQQIRILTKSSAFSACTALSFFYYFRVLYQVPSLDIVIAVKRVGPLKGLRCPLVVSPPRPLVVARGVDLDSTLLSRHPTPKQDLSHPSTRKEETCLLPHFSLMSIVYHIVHTYLIHTLRHPI